MGEVEEVHFAGSPLDQYLQEMGCPLTSTLQAPSVCVHERSEPQVPPSSRGARATTADQVAEEIAALCAEHGLLSDEAVAGLGLSKGSKPGPSAWPWVAVSLSAGLLLGLVRRRVAGFTSSAAVVGAAVLLSVGGGCSAICLVRRLLLRQAHWACWALQQLFEQAEASVQLLRALELEAEGGGLQLTSVASDFYAAVEAQARSLYSSILAILGTGQSPSPPGAHAGAARLRLAFAGVWELQEAALLAALRRLLRGERRAAASALGALGRAAAAAARQLSSELAYTESRRALAKKVPARRPTAGPGGLGARVSLSLALATFAQGLKKRREVLESPAAYNGWLQELIGRLEAHLAELDESGEPPKSGTCPATAEGAEAENRQAELPGPDEAQLLAAAGYTVIHEARGRSRPEAVAGATSELTQDDERQLRRDSRQAWRSCVDELRGCLEIRSGAAQLWQKRLESAQRVARLGDDAGEGSGFEAWGEAPLLEGSSPSRRSSRPSQAQQELMKALKFRLTGRSSESDVLEA